MRRLVFTTPDAAYPGHQNVEVKLVMTAELLATLSCMAAAIDAGASRELIALDTTVKPN